MLLHISRGVRPVYYAVLGVQQAASRLALDVPVEAEELFQKAAKALENDPWQATARKEVSSNWVVDFSRSTVDDDDARLGNLVAKMEHLNLDHERRKDDDDDVGVEAQMHLCL